MVYWSGELVQWVCPWETLEVGAKGMGIDSKGKEPMGSLQVLHRGVLGCPAARGEVLESPAARGEVLGSPAAPGEVTVGVSFHLRAQGVCPYQG